MSSCPPPPVPLRPSERVLVSSEVEYLERGGQAWLSSERLLLHAHTHTPALSAKIQAATTDEQREQIGAPVKFTLPLSKYAGSKSSAASSAKVLLMIQYVAASGVVQNLVLRFAGADANEQRAKWREVLAELPQAQPTQGQQQQEVRVKAEPGTEAATVAAAASTAPAAPARPPVVAPPAGAAVAAAAPAPALSGAKRSHAQFASPASASAAAAIPASAAASSALATAASAPSGVLSSADLQSILQSRAALLARDPVLNQLHSELVPAALSSDEFWASRERAELLRDEQLRLNLPMVSTAGVMPAQRAGISSAMAGAVKADTAGGVNTVRYTLDASQIRAIFLENPMVHELFQQLVPTQLNEREFWTKYFRSQYIHSQAANSNQLTAALAKPGGGGLLVDDLFAKAKAAQEARDNEILGIHASAQLNNASAEAAAQLLADQAARRDVETKSTILSRGIDPSVDLTASDMSDAILQADPSKTSGNAAPPSNTTRSRKAKAQTELVQKYNRHGMLVLDNTLHGGTAGATAQRNVSTAAASASAASSGSSLGAVEQKLQSSYHAGLSSSLELVDLSRETEPIYNQLPIDAARGFFFAAAGSGGGNGEGSNGGSGGVNKIEEDATVAADAARMFRSEVSHWSSAAPGASATTHSVHHVPESSSSLSLLLQLTATARGLNKAAIAAKALRETGNGSGSSCGASGSPAAQLVVFSTTGDEPDMAIPDQFRDELRKRHQICAELFRHFWTSLNPRSAPKLRRIAKSLEEQTALLQKIRDSLNVRSFSQLVPLLMPLLAQIEKCLTTYAAWEDKESKRIAAAQQQQGRRAQTPMQPNNNAAALHMPQHNNAQAAESFAKRPRT